MRFEALVTDKIKEQQIQLEKNLDGNMTSTDDKFTQMMALLLKHDLAREKDSQKLDRLIQNFSTNPPSTAQISAFSSTPLSMVTTPSILESTLLLSQESTAKQSASQGDNIHPKRRAVTELTPNDNDDAEYDPEL